MATVINAREAIFTYSNVVYRFPILGEVTEQLLSQFPGKLVQGDTSLADQTRASEWIVFGDLTGGAGIKHWRKGEHDDRFWTVLAAETRFPNEIMLAALSTQDADGTPPTEPVWMGELGTAQKVFAQTATDIYSRTGTGAWSAALLTAAQTTGKSMVQFKTTLYSFWTADYNYSTDGGATWSAAVVEPGAFAVEFDGKLVKIDATGIMKWTIEDPADAAADWTNLNNGVSVIPNKTIQGMIVWRNNNGDPTIYIGTNWGVYAFDFASEKAYLYHDFGYSDSFHCKAMEVWNQDLYVASNRILLRFTGTSIGNILFGKPRDGDIDPLFRGRVVALKKINSGLLMAMDNAGLTTRGGTIWLYTGLGWHYVAVVNATGDSIRNIAWANNILYASAWPNTGTGNTFYIQYPDTAESPANIAASKFDLGGDGVYSPYFTGGMPTVPKLALSLEAQCRRMTTTEKITLVYALDDSTTYINTAIGSTSITANGVTQKLFNGNLGTPFKNISISARLARDSGDSSKTPVMIYLKLRWRPIPTLLRGYGFMVDCSREYEGVTAEGLRANLITLLQATTQVQLDLGQPQQTIYGAVEQWSGIRNNNETMGPGAYSIFVGEAVVSA